MTDEYPTACRMVWDLAGRPHRATLGVTDTAGMCAMCGRYAPRTAPAKKWLEGKSFTDPSHLRAKSDRVCEACAWCVTGKGMDQIRMWTILARTDRPAPPSNPKAAFAADCLHFTSRADMRAVADTLASPPAGQWVVAVAESGQKHVLPYTPLNQGADRWTVRMDSLNVTATPAEFRTALAHTAALRAAGHTTDEIAALMPALHRLKTLEAMKRWRHHADALAPWGGAPLLHLTTHMISKGHLDEYTRTYPTPGPDGADGPGRQVPGRDAVQRGRGDDRAHRLVGQGTHSPSDSGVQLDTLF